MPGRRGAPLWSSRSRLQGFALFGKAGSMNKRRIFTRGPPSHSHQDGIFIAGAMGAAGSWERALTWIKSAHHRADVIAIGIKLPLWYRKLDLIAAPGERPKVEKREPVHRPAEPWLFQPRREIPL